MVLNAKRWLLGADSYGSDLTNYRRYLVNYEFGHALGKHHVDCPGPGKLAPVMMQQTKGLGGAGRTHGRSPAKIDSGASAIGTPRAPGRRVANSRQRSSAPARERPRGTGALERLQWTGLVHAVAHQASLDTAWWVVTACRRGSPLLFTAATAARPSSGFGEIPAQQCGGLQVADLAERSGVP